MPTTSRVDYWTGYIAGVLFSGRSHDVDHDACATWLRTWVDDRERNFEDEWDWREGAQFRELLYREAHHLDRLADNHGAETIGVAELEALEQHIRALEERLAGVS